MTNEDRVTRLERVMQTVTAIVARPVRQFLTASSGYFASDCLLHAELARVLMADLGIQARTVVGYAAWRLGPGDGDVIIHVPSNPDVLPAERQVLYHTWLELDCLYADVTTYQLKFKAESMDVGDGQHTTVNWCPDFLVVRRGAVRSLEAVRDGWDVGRAFYRPASVDFQYKIKSGFEPDPEDVEIVRRLLVNPAANVVGPNHVLGVPYAPASRRRENRSVATSQER